MLVSRQPEPENILISQLLLRYTMSHREVKLKDIISVFHFDVFVMGVEVVVNSVRKVIDRLNTVAPHVLDVFAF